MRKTLGVVQLLVAVVCLAFAVSVASSFFDNFEEEEPAWLLALMVLVGLSLGLLFLAGAVAAWRKSSH